MDFVTIGNPNNSADTTGSPNPVGSVPYVYNLGKFEVSRDMVLKASTAGGLGLTLQDMNLYGGNGANRPATGISWNEAARFVNWLNTSKGYQAAYLFDGSGNFQLWSSARAAGDNLFRHKNAHFFLPSVDEWYKGAYYDPSKAGGAGYWNFPTGSDEAPTIVTGGTSGAVTFWSTSQGPADITNAGSLSPYGTMAQGGNAWEWNESAFDYINNDATEVRAHRGGSWDGSWSEMHAAISWVGGFPTTDDDSLIDVGFRVAMIPEPSSLSLLLAGGAVLMAGRRRDIRKDIPKIPL